MIVDDCNKLLYSLFHFIVYMKVLCSYLNIIGNNRYISKVQCGIYFIHDIQWRWFVMMKSKYLKQNTTVQFSNQVFTVTTCD